MNQRDNSDNNSFNNSSQGSVDAYHFGLTLVDKASNSKSSKSVNSDTGDLFLKSVKQSISKDLVDKTNAIVDLYSNCNIKEEQTSEGSKVFQLHLKNKNQTISILGYSIAITDEIALKTSFFARTFLANELLIKSQFDEDSVSKIFKKLNRRIFERGLEDARFSGSGLALAVVLKEDQVFKIANVGDVRAYVLFSKLKDNNQNANDTTENYLLKLITKDHTLTQELSDTEAFNENSKSEINISESDDILTRYIGKAPHLEFSFNVIKETLAEKFSKVVLLTNGIYKATKEEDLLKTLTSTQCQDSFQELILKCSNRIEFREYCKAVTVVSNDKISINQNEQTTEFDVSDDFVFADKLEDELKDFEIEPDIEDLAIFSKVVDNKKNVVIPDVAVSSAQKPIEVISEESNNIIPVASPAEFVAKVEEPHHRYAGEAPTDDDEEEFGGIHEVKIPMVLDPVIANPHANNAVEAVSIDNVVENKNIMSSILSASAKDSNKSNTTGGIFRPTELNYGSANLKLGKSSTPQAIKQTKKNNKSLTSMVLTGIFVGILAGVLFMGFRFKDSLTRFISDKYTLVTASIWKDTDKTIRQAESKKVIASVTKEEQSDSSETDANEIRRKVEKAMRDDLDQNVTDEIYAAQLNEKTIKKGNREKLPEIELSSIASSSRASLSDRNLNLEETESPKISYDGYKLPLVSKIETITDPDLKLMFTDVIDAIKKSQDRSEKRFISVAIKQEQIASKIEDLSTYVDRLAEIIDKKQVDLEQDEEVQK